MKTLLRMAAVLFPVLALSACGNSERYNALEQVVEEQNKTIIQQQQTLLDQQDKLVDQDFRLTALTDQVAMDEALLKQLQAATTAVAAAPATPPSTVDQHKVATVRYLAGFSARLSSSIGYDAYSDALSDLNSNLVQGMLDIKDQNFINEVNQIRDLYNYAGDFWQRFSSDGDTELSLSPVDRFKYASAGVNFSENYNPRPTDVKKFWAAASDDLQKLINYNSEALGRQDNTVQLFAH